MGSSVLSGSQRKQIKSYVLRQGRMTTGQSRAIEAGWPDFGLHSSNGQVDFDATFGRHAPTVLEVGFGMGDSLVTQAKQSPEKNFIGVEVHKPGVGHLLMQAIANDVANLRVFNEDSWDVLTDAIPPTSLSAMQLFFPDPWPKKRHHKRRLLDASFLGLLVTKLEPGGLVHIATDWVPYSEDVETLFARRQDFVAATVPWRPETKFERRGRRLGHEVRDMAYRLVQ